MFCSFLLYIFQSLWKFTEQSVGDIVREILNNSQDKTIPSAYYAVKVYDEFGWNTYFSIDVQM